MPSDHTPHQTLTELQQGNQRFVTGAMAHHDHQATIHDTQNSQSPKAVVLGCMDSRCPPELIFDQGIGDLLTLRVAGPVLNDAMLASLGFGCDVLGASLIVVLGHTKCGAITAACQDKGGHIDHIHGVVVPIQAAIDAHPNISGNDQIHAVTRTHVQHIMQAIPEQSVLLKRMLEDKKIHIVGGIYDVATGQVSFFDEAND